MALVPIELSETLHEDGRLLRMFVARGEHKKAEARELATRGWLIREAVYDEHLEAFVRRYAPAEAEGVDLSKESQQLVEICKGALGSNEKQSVDTLESHLREADGDVFKLRDMLLAAVKDLGSPRRLLGTTGGMPMPESAIEALKQQRQVRLRDVVLACLQEIWDSGVGGEVLRVAMENVHRMINRFEAKSSDEVCTARQGEQWHRLKELIAEIEGQQETDDCVDGSHPSRQGQVVEGRGTKALIAKALADMGGQATTNEIYAWVESHPEVVGPSIRLNQRVVKVKGKDFFIWQTTIRSVLSHHFDSVSRKSARRVWRAKGTGSPVAIEDAASSSVGGDAERVDAGERPEKKRLRRASVASSTLPTETLLGGDASASNRVVVQPAPQPAVLIDVVSAEVRAPASAGAKHKPRTTKQCEPRKTKRESSARTSAPRNTQRKAPAKANAEKIADQARAVALGAAIDVISCS